MKKKILFFLETLNGGGAERVLDVIVHHLDRNLFDVTVLVVNGGGVYEKSVASEVDYRCIFKGVVCKNLFYRMLYSFKYKLIYDWLPVWVVYRWVIPQKYDVEIAFVEGFATKLLSASSNKKSKKIAWVHCDLERYPWTLDKSVFSSLKEEIKSYRKFDTVVCVSRNVEKVMRDRYGLDSVCTIYNPVDVHTIIEMGKESSSFKIDKNEYNIISVGRLDYQKGFDMLLTIINKIKQDISNVHLWIVGTGNEYVSLKKQVEDLSLSKYVTFTGFMNNPYSLMSKMNLFVCSSRSEGFSLAIAEALILNTPVISMKCSGPCELIQDGKNGVLCDSYDMLEYRIRNAISGAYVPVGIPGVINIDDTMRRISCLLEM